MNVKRYVANDMSEAMNKIKYELGSEAVILSSRNVRRKGIKGIFSKPVVEVVAAYEDKYIPSKKVTGQATEVINTYTKQKNTNVNENLDKVSLEKKLDDMNKMVESLITNAKEKEEVSVKVQPNIQAYTPIQIENVNEKYSAQLLGLINTLIANDVDEKIAMKLADEVNEIIKNRKDADEYNVMKILLEDYLGDPAPITLKKFRRRVIVLAGPTGIGKTTTIAKLASIFSLKLDSKVCVMTSDTYKISAVEQLKTYADILNIPFEVIEDVEKVDVLLKKHEDKDVVLIDTAGRSPSDSGKIDEVSTLIEKSLATEVYLVISATTSYKNILHIIENYSMLENYKLIFTKIDETPTLGNLLNVTYTSGKRIGYITMGQNVPDDIEILDRDKIVTSLIGEK